MVAAQGMAGQQHLPVG
jgi:hypothetical protein